MTINFIFKLVVAIMFMLILGFKGKKINFSSYQGQVVHHRYKTKDKDEFKFKYNVKYDYFDLKSPPNSILASFRRSDYIGPKEVDIYDFIIESIKKKEKNEYTGIDQIKFLGNIRSYFYCFNPICLFYCYNDNKLKYIFAQVSNIPWKEQTAYILKIDDNGMLNKDSIFHEKKMHVSPFNPSKGQIYEFKLNSKNKDLRINVYNTPKKSEVTQENLLMTITLALKENRFNYLRLPRNHITVLKIYYQALFLYLKKYRYFKHL
ncbi:Protein of unknown function (DUF1365) [seawater metagenome]|uniref:DUF1365 domain-containing protein n=1 Tax=seawater metagenome TaxID=1561972 RepID=A0A5E8CLT7_9ZZZZ